jgi:protein-tyrosine phosphatase
MSDRRVELQGAFNFRDVGGVRTARGSMVVCGRVFRSDALHRLTSGDAAILERIGIARVFDLRSPEELRKEGIGNFCQSRHVHVPLVQQSLSPFDPGIDWAQVDLRGRYVEMLELGGEAIRVIFEAVGEHAAPIVFHCAGGKDRTGVVAAVLLRTLGVPDGAIVEDYALSETYLRTALEPYRRELLERRFAPDVVAYLTSSPPQRMRATLRELDMRWGSTEAYLHAIGVGDDVVARLKECLLR